MVHVRLEETKRANWYRVLVFGRRIADARRVPSGLFHVKPLETQFRAEDRLERLMNEEGIEALAMRSKLVTDRIARATDEREVAALAMRPRLVTDSHGK